MRLGGWRVLPRTEEKGGRALHQVRSQGHGSHTGARISQRRTAGGLAQGVAGKRRKAHGPQPRALHAGAEEGRGQAPPRPWEARRPRQARAWIPQAHGEARRADRRVRARREKGDAAPGVRLVREGRRRQAPGISGVVRSGGRRPGRMHEISALQAEARAAQGGVPDVRRPPQQARAYAGKIACDPGGHRRPRGQEGRARGRARGAQARVRHHGGYPRGPGKGTSADPANELTNGEKTLPIGSLRPKWRLCELLSPLGVARSSHRCQQGALRAPDRDEEARRRISEVFDANGGIYGRRCTRV